MRIPRPNLHLAIIASLSAALGLPATPTYAQSGPSAAGSPAAQQETAPESASGPLRSIEEGMKRSEETGLPVVVFGLSDTCHRCQGLKRSIEESPEFKLLLSQYVRVEIPFGGREFGQAFMEIIQKDPSIPAAIGAPSAFVYTSAGNVVYAGPNREEGIRPDDEFKEILVSGIRENGGLRLPEAGADPALRADLAKAQGLLAKGDTLAAAQLMGKHLHEPTSSAEAQGADHPLAALTGLKPAASKLQSQRDRVIEQLLAGGDEAIAEALTLAKSDKAILGAVRLLQVAEAYADYPAMAEKLDAAWKATEPTVGPKPREQAVIIARALAAERSGDTQAAVREYEQVAREFPGTRTAEMSQIRAAQLQPADPGQLRKWTSKDGKFSVEAAMLSLQGDAVRLRTTEGKVLTVPLASLSAADVQFARQ